MQKSLGIRDPVLPGEWIKFTQEEKDIIDSPLFQRLNWVTQLPSVRQVFPGGTHTRFSHSLGVMKIAGKYAYKVFNSVPLGTFPRESSHYIQLARLAGLLHDIGHGPFSHSFDRVVYKQIYGIEDGGHDIHRMTIITSGATKLPELIRKTGVTPEEIIAVWSSNSIHYLDSDVTNRHVYDIIRAIVQGPLGADRIDFTLRDSYFTGTSHLGTISLGRILGDVHLKLTDGVYRLHYSVKSLPDIIQAMESRRYMYECVYLNKTCEAVSLLIELALEKSCDDLCLIERTLDLNKFIWLNEYTLLGEMLQNPFSKSIAERLLLRNLPKLSRTNPTDEKIIRTTRNVKGVDPEKFDKHHIYFYCPETDKSLTANAALDKIGWIIFPEKRITREYYVSI